VWVLLNDKRETVWKDTVACHPAHINISVKKLPVLPMEVKVAIEPVCGWRWVTKQLEEAGFEIHIAHPQKVRLIAESKQKNDLNDATILADLLRVNMFPESYRISDDIHELREKVRERHFLVVMRTSAKNRLHGVATSKGLHLIEGNNPLLRRGTDQINKGNDEVMKELLAVIEELNSHIDIITKKINEKAKELPLAKLLMTMPGIGAITAFTVITEIGDFSRFGNAKKLASFAGLVPRQRSSGDNIRLGPITNMGSKFLRSAMVEAAMRIRESNAPELYEFVTNLKPSCGAKRARVALGRKMLTIMWAMVKNNCPYSAKFIINEKRSSLPSAIRSSSDPDCLPDA
jgi:transposase